MDEQQLLDQALTRGSITPQNIPTMEQVYGPYGMPQKQMTTTKLSPLQITRAINETLTQTKQRLSHLLELNEKLHEMDAYPSQFVSIIEDEIFTAIDAIIDYDPTPDTPYDFFHQ
jgi:hypothetical protein